MFKLIGISISSVVWLWFLWTCAKNT